MNVERCDRCKNAICTGRRENNNLIYRLCNGCRAELERMEDRLIVLEGFVEAVERLAQPIR